jgi:RHS repeat-associated protein
MKVSGPPWLLRLPSAAGWFLLPLLLVRVAGELHAQSTPRLNIERTPFGTVLVQWPVGDGLFKLQERPGFDSTEGWRPLEILPKLAASVYQLELEPSDRTLFFRLYPVIQPEPGLVPAPETLAPPPPVNAQGSFADSTAFLYSGPSSVQIGVVPGTITPQRASVLRGKVKKRDGTPLTGVHVRILNHPEFGFTYTRADGMFDLGVNGGPLYTVDFLSRGYCPAQRQVQAPLQDFRCLEDVILVGMDPIATPVAFGTNAALQVAKSSVQTDKAGTRSATVLFPPGTCATLELPDGTIQDCGTLTIRATEFTVGPNGPQAMPGPLPPTSAYTYAVELSGDEAVAAGANTIRFNQFVHVYVDNFLNIPTGALMPSAYYDRQLSAWVPQENGVVIQVLGVAGGTARVDVNGDGVEETASDLEILAFTLPELQHLAANYAPGKTLWRMPAKHFTAMDYNCPENPVNRDNPKKPGDRARGNPNDKARGHGSVNLASQVFEETIPLVGVPMELHYSSARVPGYRVDAELRLPLIGDSVPENLIKVRVDMDVAGRRREFEYPTNTNQTAEFAWDGFDAYGRLLNDSQRAFFSHYYFYPRIYGGHRRGDQIIDISQFAPLFGNYGDFSSTIAHNEVGQAVAINFDRILTIPDHRKVGLGGWSLTPHHRYDPVGRILYLGDGTVQRPESLANGLAVRELDRNFTVQNFAAASDGSYWLTERGGRVHRMTASGTLSGITATVGPDGLDLPNTVVVRHGDFTAADGKPASQVRLNQTPWHDIAVGPDDSLYLRTYWSIVRITPDGLFHVVIGKTASENFPPDGSLARNPGVATSDIGNAFVAVGTDHTVYYNDEWTIGGQRRDYVRKISTDGRISTLIGPAGRAAGPEETQYFTEGPAIEVKTATITGLNVAPDGSVYVAGGFGMVRINPGGTAAHVMNGAAVSGENNPDTRFRSEGQPANSPAPYRINATYVNHLQIGPDGLPYFYFPQGPGFIWKIDSDGLFQRVAGKWGAPFESGASPLAVQIGDVRDFTFHPSGALTLLSQPPGSLGGGGNFSLRRIGPAFPGFDAAELQVAARDGSELYIFNHDGLHLRTLDTWTGATNWQFTYNSRNLITEMRDVNGLATRIERSTDGTPNAIVAPYGQRTLLAVDASGFLSEVTDPAGATARLGYGPAGLLTSIEGPRGNTFGVTYDSKGRANRLSDPNGGGLQIHHSFVGAADYATVTDTVGGDHAVRDLFLGSNGDSIITTTAPDGTRSTEVRPLSGGSVSTLANGTVVTTKETGDPRFRGQTLVLESLALDFPGGLKSSVSVTRTAGLLLPEQPFTHTQLVAQVTLNGAVFTQEYDSVARRLTSTTPEGRQAISAFDALGKVTFEQSGADAPVTRTYDGLGRLDSITETVGTDPRITRLAYNAAGRTEQVTDPIARVLRLTYADAGRPQQVTLPGGSVVGFEYDAEAHLTGLTPPGRPKHQFRYDPTGSLLEYTPPTVATDDSWHYAYDPDRSLTNIALPDGQNGTIVRGPGGRPSHLVLGSGATLSYGYHGGTGQLTNVVSSTGAGITFGYQGSLQVFSLWSGVITGMVSLQFDANLQAQVQTVNGSSISYAYDKDGLITQVGEMTISRDPASGRALTNTLGALREVFAYDSRGNLTSTVVTLSEADGWRTSLRYDRLNRLTNRIETISGVTHDDRYAYDEAGRLSQVQRDGVTTALYTYDANGNRLTRSGETAMYDAQDRLTSYDGATFGWSRNGHRTTRTAGGQVTEYEYDIRGGLRSVTLPTMRVEYVLDPLGRRIGRNVGGVLERGWLWQGSRIVAEVDAASVVTKRFGYVDDSSITPVFMTEGTQSYRILQDERGSVRFVLNTADGSVVQALEYDEFGRVLLDTNPGFQPFGYAGGLHDPATGLVRFGFRDYDPQTGQWTARDPIRFAGGQTSLYAYVRNNPINWVDPTGTGPFSGSPKNHKGRLSPHQLRIIDEATRKIARNREASNIRYQIGAQHDRVVEQIRRATKLNEEDLDYIENIAQEAAEEITHVYEFAKVGALDAAMDLAEAGSKIVHTFVEEATGDALRKSKDAAKKAGDLRGPGAKGKPFETWNPSSW